VVGAHSLAEHYPYVLVAVIRRVSSRHGFRCKVPVNNAYTVPLLRSPSRHLLSHDCMSGTWLRDVVPSLDASLNTLRDDPWCARYLVPRTTPSHDH
ncbi:hypothetical protein SPRG_01281, partial [Saprolegnia parasitica CBS 223.65]